MKISRRHRQWMLCGCIATLGLLCSARSHGADEAPPDRPPPSDADTWRYAVTIYGFLPSVYGETTFPGGTAGPSFTIDQHKILSSLRFAFMGTLRVRKGDWGLLTDVFYSDLSDSLKATRDFRLEGKPPVGATARLKLGSKTTILTLAGTYAVMDTPRDSMSLLFGTRMIKLTQKLDWTLSATLPGLWTGGLDGRNTFDHSYWDAVVGVTGRSRFGEDFRWFVPYHLDAGTGGSRFTGQAVLGIGYSYRWGEVTAAWRYVDYNFRSSENVSRLAFSGPALGLTYRF